VKTFYWSIFQSVTKCLNVIMHVIGQSKVHNQCFITHLSVDPLSYTDVTTNIIGQSVLMVKSDWLKSVGKT